MIGSQRGAWRKRRNCLQSFYVKVKQLFLPRGTYKFVLVRCVFDNCACTFSEILSLRFGTISLPYSTCWFAFTQNPWHFFFSEKEKRSQLNEISSLLPNALPEARSKAIHFGEFCTSTPSISTIEE